MKVTNIPFEVPSSTSTRVRFRRGEHTLYDCELEGDWTRFMIVCQQKMYPAGPDLGGPELGREPTKKPNAYEKKSR